MINCPLCTKKFSRQSNLDHHIVTHTKEKPHKCPVCLKTFGHKNGLKSHVRSFHEGIKQIRSKNHHCTVCSFKCYSKSDLQVHLRKHSAELPFSCHQPGCGFKTKYKCVLSKHVLQVHSDKRPFKCPSDGCSYKAKTRTSITEHLKVHSNDKPFSCIVPGCNVTCRNKGRLKTHTTRVHCDEKKFACSVCDFRTKYSNSLRLHQLTHSKIERLQCQAPNCGFASHLEKNLKEHFDRKHRTQEVSCTEPRCNFRCGSVALLKVHLKRHNLPILNCPGDSCGFTTKYNHCLLRHISRRHKDYQPSVTVVGTRISNLKTAGRMSTLYCSFIGCGYETKFPYHYDRHVITHKKEEKRQHVCSFCFSRFDRSSHLKAHVQRHTREKPYSCSQCSFTTMESFQLKQHARKTHQIHVIPCGKEDEVRMCHTCGRKSFSFSDIVLHSMCHLQPVVVLEQLKLFVL